MRVLDTNVVIRLIAEDDMAQADKAQAIIEAGEAFILKTVVMECEWVLRSLYGLKRPGIAASLRGILGLDGVIVEDAAVVERTLDWFEAGMDFADAMHLASTPSGATFVSFDRALAGRAARSAGAPAVTTP